MRDKLKLIQECMDRAVANQEVAGVIALEIKDGKEIFFAKSGYADIKNNIPISRDNIFRLYSQSKPITATAAMMLIEDGILDLSEPVGNYIESYNKQTYLSKSKVHKVPEENKMRIRELLNMTSGLVYPGLPPPLTVPPLVGLAVAVTVYEGCSCEKLATRSRLLVTVKV